jgi:hypothetical protein
LENLNIAISEFASGIPRAGMSSAQLAALPDAQRVGQYLVNVAEHALEMVQDHQEGELASSSALAVERNHLRATAVSLLDLTQVDRPDWKADTLAQARRDFETDYQALKAGLLHAGTSGDVLPRRMASMLERLSDLHRVVDQATKSAVYLDRYLTESRVQLVSPPGGIVRGQSPLPQQGSLSPQDSGSPQVSQSSTDQEGSNVA